ncbi:MAG TPA: hypothetical protein VE988_24925 [Gemmataceae bacterium]|nr:hypothetical protein [Gemmataceae bacterium]
MHTSSRFLALALVTGLIGGLCGLSRAGQAQQKQGDKINDAAFAKLIEQLGSKQFKERDAADKALERIGYPAIEALRKAAKSSDAEVANRAARLVGILENSLDQLLVDYRDYGMPMPSKDAKLVKFESGGRYIVNDKLMPPTYSVGFLLHPETKDSPASLLVGTKEVRLDLQTPVEVIEPKPGNAKIINDLSFNPTIYISTGQIIAIQCKALGWDDLAKELWTLSSTGPKVVNPPGGIPFRTAIANLAWGYYKNELVKPDSDRALAAKQMKKLLAAESEINTEGNQALLKSLDAALIPSTAKAGSLERLVDDLVDMCNGSEFDRDPRYDKLANQGFAAVPILIQHLDDDRLTRSIMPGFNNFRSWNMRVKHVVSDLLREIAADDLDKDWLDRQVGRAVEKADAEAWWKKASKEGEEAYFVAHVLPSGEKQGWPNALMLEIIAEKYPGHLPKLYKTLLDERPKIESWPMAEQVNKSKLSADEKRKVFLYAANHADLKHRRFGLEYLESYEPKEFIRILLGTLEDFPVTPNSKSYWIAPEVGFVHVVLKTDNPKVWATLEKVAKRADVGFRMELMNQFNQFNVNDKNRQRCLNYLAAFLDDKEGPDRKANPKMFDGPHAGFTFERLSVQDLAAWQIARILKMPERPDREWTAEQWEKLRAKVTKALAK